MPFIFRYKGFVIRFWYCFEERRRHVHAISDEANVKLWLEPEIAVASVKEDKKGRVKMTAISGPTIPVPVIPYLGYAWVPKASNLTYGVAAFLWASIERDKLVREGGLQ